MFVLHKLLDENLLCIFLAAFPWQRKLIFIHIGKLQNDLLKHSICDFFMEIGYQRELELIIVPKNSKLLIHIERYRKRS